MKWVLSKMMVITCRTLPSGELSWQPPAEVAGAAAAAAFAVAASQRIKGEEYRDSHGENAAVQTGRTICARSF